MKIVLLEWNNDYGANLRIGEKTVKDLSVDEAHRTAEKFVAQLQEYKRNTISYNIEVNKQIVAYAPTEPLSE